MDRRNVLPASCRQRPAESRPVGPFRARPPSEPSAVRAVCRRDARQHAVKTAVRGPQQRGVRGRLPLGEPIPSRRDQCTVTPGRRTCLVPSRGDLWSDRWRVAPRQPARLAGQAARNMKPSSTRIHPESVWIGATCCRHLAGRGPPNPAPWDLSEPSEPCEPSAGGTHGSTLLEPPSEARSNAASEFLAEVEERTGRTGAVLTRGNEEFHIDVEVFRFSVRRRLGVALRGSMRKGCRGLVRPFLPLKTRINAGSSPEQAMCGAAMCRKGPVRWAQCRRVVPMPGDLGGRAAQPPR